MACICTKICTYLTQGFLDLLVGGVGLETKILLFLTLSEHNVCCFTLCLVLIIYFQITFRCTFIYSSKTQPYRLTG